MLLEMSHIYKTYGNVKANVDISFALNKGEILAIVGENGAGKSTLMKILYGLEKPDSGEIRINNNVVKITCPSDAMKLGIGMVQQHFMLFPPMTITENIVYNNEISKYGFFAKKKNTEAVKALSDKYMLKVDPDSIVKDCPVGTQQRVEILKILYQNADIIIFDEPSAVLTPLEVDDLLLTMKKLASSGKSIILITHKLNEVMNVSDRVVVMRNGNKITEVMTKDTSIDELSYLMIGRQSQDLEIKSHKIGNCLLETTSLSLVENKKYVLNDVNIHVNEGEIVGIAGVSGNGQTELIQCITGLITNYTGNLNVCNKDVSNCNVNIVRKAGLSYIPEDRYFWGSAKEANLSENALMSQQDNLPYSKHGLLNLDTIRKHTKDMINEYDIKADSTYQKIKELSGGNAQKLITGREIEQNTPILIACEPTRGIDIGAMEFVHERLIDKRNRNDGVLLVSSELSEILKLSDRIYVIYNGKIVGEFKHGEIDDVKLGVLMLGGKNNEETDKTSK